MNRSTLKVASRTVNLATGPSGNSRIALKMPHIASIWPSVTLRPLFAILIAVAMLFAPLAMQSGSAMAATPSDHHSQTIDKGHCEGQPASDRDSDSAEKPCCAAMCTAIAVALVSPARPVAFTRSIDFPSLQQFRHGFLAKLPTPPPRRA